MDVSINRTSDFREMTISYGAGTTAGETIIGGIARADILLRGTAQEWMVWHSSIGEISDSMYPDSTSAIAAAREWFATRAICRTCGTDWSSVFLRNGECVGCTRYIPPILETATDAVTGTYADALECGDSLW